MKLFKNKIFIITSSIVVGLIVILVAAYFVLSHQIKLNGSSKVYISYKEEYKEAGVSLKLFGKDLSNKIKIVGSVKNGKVGTYKITYKAKYLFFNIERSRTVYVQDKDKPVITLVGENKVNVCPSEKYEEEGYKAYDEYDGNISNKVEIKEEENRLVYKVKDSSGNEEKVFREVIKEDTEGPTIKLKGSSTVYVKVNSSYEEYGYSVTDNCDSNLEATKTNNIDTTKEGSYKVTYKATDKSGNTNTIERSVVVYDPSRVGRVYLTFDDGPSGSGSTEKILNILKEENVKATFFVTGKGPDNLIKREFDEGHTVALHTNSHDYYTLYKSVDAYYKDLNAVRNRVYNITGEYTNIIRFPGGSNNTVSITASGYKIMNTLTKDVTEKGYVYYDWNISSGDAGDCSKTGSSSCVYNNVVRNLSKNRINMVLMHDIKMYTANALKDIIEYCKLNGYVFEVIDETTPQIKFQ